MFLSSSYLASGSTRSIRRNRMEQSKPQFALLLVVDGLARVGWS
jgi:hypothetical protein